MCFGRSKHRKRKRRPDLSATGRVECHHGGPDNKGDSREWFPYAPRLGLCLIATFAIGVAEAQVVTIDPPARQGAFMPALAQEGATTVSKAHDILMTWLEPGDAGHHLRFARFSEAGWSEPITVAAPVSVLEPVDRSTLTVLDTQAVRRTLIAPQRRHDRPLGQCWPDLEPPAVEGTPICLVRGR